jgi:hypothetical protein
VYLTKIEEQYNNIHVHVAVAVSKCISDDVGTVFQQQPSSIEVVHGRFFYSTASFICAVDERVSCL